MPKNEYVKCCSHELYPHKNTQWTKPEIQQTFQIQLKINKKSLFDSNTNRKASSWCLLRLSNLKTSHTFLNSSPAIFNLRLPELHARFLCVTSSDMQGEMWLVHKSLRHGKRSRGSSSQTLFSAEPVTAGNTYAFAGYSFIIGTKFWYVNILGDPGATSRDDAIFLGESLL